MDSLSLHELYQSLQAQFGEVNGAEVVQHFGDPTAEHRALLENAGVIDLSFRSRLCLTGSDRQKFLHGQVTNDINRLKVGDGCYAALITAKGKMQSDLNIYLLLNEILLDFEPGLSAPVTQRLERYIIADDVQIVDAAPHYGLLSVQGPSASAVVSELGLVNELPINPGSFVSVADPDTGEVYVMNRPRLGTNGFDLFVPQNSLRSAAEKLIAAAKIGGGRACGWEAFEVGRIEAGIPRYGVDMDETNLAPETGIEDLVISYTKGCYIGQEVISRIRTYGQVQRHLRGLRLSSDPDRLPHKGDKLFYEGREAGYVTSAVRSHKFQAVIALGYVRREADIIGNVLSLREPAAEESARVVELPFQS